MMSERYRHRGIKDTLKDIMEQLTERELDDFHRGSKSFRHTQELKSARPPVEGERRHISKGMYPPSLGEVERRVRKMKFRAERVEYSPPPRPRTERASSDTRYRRCSCRSVHKYDRVRRRELPKPYEHSGGRDRPSSRPRRQHHHRSETPESSSNCETEMYTLTGLAKMTRDTKLTMRKRNEKNHVILQREMYKKILRGEYVATDTVIHALTHLDWSLDDLEKLPRLEPKLSHVMTHVAVLGDIYSCKFPNLSADMHAYAFELSRLSLTYCDATVASYHNRFFRKVMRHVAAGNNLPSLRTIDQVELMSAVWESSSPTVSSSLSQHEFRQPQCSRRLETHFAEHWFQDTTTYQ